MVNIALSLLHWSLGLLTLASIVRTMKASSSTSLRPLPPHAGAGRGHPQAVPARQKQSDEGGLATELELPVNTPSPDCFCLLPGNDAAFKPAPSSKVTLWALCRIIWPSSTARTQVTGQRVFPLGDTGMRTYITTLDCRKTPTAQNGGPDPIRSSHVVH
ncbi:hypothetical protein PR003_g744 [Phytophthora rubi]|uniref:Secreted protein n=1 Tax=Phytophthora rubi TaxID=129364 RepID=A0A6A4FXL0_9STRA|nr:hypothetical protein PR002_g632 [Phytophthora rubi]KAE9051350.1 hypothetical protein PR001_g1534 [Phytophthora rubi]KAE9359444.1 hypothetical protein PR003_g744 [Phytophthora rubi]